VSAIGTLSAREGFVSEKGARGLKMSTKAAKTTSSATRLTATIRSQASENAVAPAGRSGPNFGARACPMAVSATGYGSAMSAIVGVRSVSGKAMRTSPARTAWRATPLFVIGQYPSLYTAKSAMGRAAVGAGFKARENAAPTKLVGFCLDGGARTCRTALSATGLINATEASVRAKSAYAITICTKAAMMTTSVTRLTAITR
jgi:hypothetical protein